MANAIQLLLCLFFMQAMFSTLVLKAAFPKMPWPIFLEELLENLLYWNGIAYVLLLSASDLDRGLSCAVVWQFGWIFGSLAIAGWSASASLKPVPPPTMYLMLFECSPIYASLEIYSIQLDSFSLSNIWQWVQVFILRSAAILVGLFALIFIVLPIWVVVIP